MATHAHRLLSYLVVLAAAATAAQAASAFPGANGQVAFTSDRDGNNEIYVVQPDGTGATNLTNHPDTDQSPAWSADGARITFGTFRDGRQAIYVMNADGTGQTRLSPADNGLSDDADPAWSPDGRSVAFSSTRPFGDSWAVWAVDADGSNLRRLTPGWGTDPAWSPDGTRIAYVGLDPSVDGGSAIYVMNADGTGVRRLTSSTLAEDQPAWSPDGSRVVFARFRSDWRTSNAHELYVANADGTGERRLTGGGYYDGNPAWSPDGTRIAFQRHAGTFGAQELYVLTLATNLLEPLQTGWGRSFTPDWGVATTTPPPPPSDDRTPPSVIVTSPEPEAVYFGGQDVYALFRCVDGDGRDARPAAVCEATVDGSPVASGAPLPTMTAGWHTFVVLAEDEAGNRIHEVRAYRVVYAFSGFASPVASFPEVNVFKAGHGVPLKFSLSGFYGFDVVPAWAPVSRELPCDAMPAAEGGEQTVGTLSYNEAQDRYTYLWQTDRAWAGTCRQLTLVLNDGSRQHANFRFTK